MDVEIEIVGKEGKWLLNQPRIRIGRGAKCNVNLPARQYPGVALVHAELEVTGGIVRLVAAAEGSAESFINDEPAEPGSVLLSGDTLRLGRGGPELRVRFGEREAVSPIREPSRMTAPRAQGGYEPTRLMSIPDSTVEQPSRMAGDPAKSPTPPPARTTVPVAAPPASQAYQQRPAPSPERQPSGGDMGKPSQPFARPSSRQVAEHEMDIVENRLRAVQVLQVISLVFVVIVLIWNVQLQRELAQTRDDVRTLRSQAQNAVSQFTPALDQRLSTFDQRMNGMDSRMKVAQDRLETSLDAHVKSAEDQMYNNLDSRMKEAEQHMMDRINTDLPSVLDKYISQRMDSLKH